MTKEELQKELKEKVKPGVKPSRLKRSRSLGDIPKAPPLPKSTPLAKSKSTERIESTPSSQIEKLEAKISVLELKLEVSQRELTAKENEKQNAFIQKQLFSDQLARKQKELEELRAKLEVLSPAQELDHSLFARH